MKHKLVSIILAAVIIAMLFSSAIVPSPALAKDKDKKPVFPIVVGQEVQVDEYTKVKCIGKNYDKKGNLVSIEYAATISSVPTTTPDGELIDPTWYLRKDSAGHTYYESGTNYFEARVIGGRASVKDENNKLAVWNPFIVIVNRLYCYSDTEPKLVDDLWDESYKNN